MNILVHNVNCVRVNASRNCNRVIREYGCLAFFFFRIYFFDTNRHGKMAASFVGSSGDSWHNEPVLLSGLCSEYRKKKNGIKSTMMNRTPFSRRGPSPGSLTVEYTSCAFRWWNFKISSDLTMRRKLHRCIAPSFEQKSASGLRCRFSH